MRLLTTEERRIAFERGKFIDGKLHIWGQSEFPCYNERGFLEGTVRYLVIGDQVVELLNDEVMTS